jgi:hypothetical protein
MSRIRSKSLRRAKEWHKEITITMSLINQNLIWPLLGTTTKRKEGDQKSSNFIVIREAFQRVPKFQIQWLTLVSLKKEEEEDQGKTKSQSIMSRVKLNSIPYCFKISGLLTKLEKSN